MRWQSFPGPDSPASCYLLEAEGFRLLIDLGNGALGVAAAARRPVRDRRDLPEPPARDHCLDLASYWVARTFAPDGPKPADPRVRAGRDRRPAGRSPGPQHRAGMRPAFSFATLTPGTRRIGPFDITVAA